MITLLVFLVIVGFAVYLIDRYVPMAEPFKTIFRVLIVLLFVAFLLKLVGINVPYIGSLMK